MKINELTFEVRDAELNRVGQLMPSDLVGWQSVLRFNNVGTWQITLEATHPLTEALSTPGAGIVVTHVDAGVIMSGPTISAEVSRDAANVTGRVLITGLDDSAVLAERLAYPTPQTDDVTAQTQSHDVVTNVKSSTAMRTFVAHNCVSGVAPASRAIPYLTLGADPLLGSTITKRARFDVLGELLNEIAILDGLGFDVKQNDLQLVFNVFQPADRTKTIRMDVANNTLASTKYGYAKPGLTQAIVAGQGDLEERQFVQVNTADSLQAETLWKRRIEQFIDQRNTDVLDELQQAGLEALAESGFTLTSVDVVPASDSTMRFGYDWNLGDLVTVVVDEQEVSAIVTEVAISVDGDGVHLVATVGEPTGVDYEALIARRQASNTRRINALERVESAAPGIATGGGGASVTVSATAPASPTVGTIWFNLNNGLTFIWVDDGNSQAWVQDSSVVANDSALDGRLTAVESKLPSTGLTIANGGTGANNVLAAQANLGIGLVPLIPPTINISGGSATANSNGVVSFTSATSISFNNVFNSTFHNYRVVIRLNTGSASHLLYARMRANGSDATTAIYYQGSAKAVPAAASSTVYGVKAASQFVAASLSTSMGAVAMTVLDVMGPNLSGFKTLGTITGIVTEGADYFGIAGGWAYDSGAVLDGMTFFPSAGNVSGTIQFFGYRQ